MITLDDLCAHMLPPDDRITLQSLIIEEPRLILVAAMSSPHSSCPDCRQPTQRIHGHYPRTLADLPWATAPIELRIIVRRFRCCTGTCRRQTFAECLPHVAPLYARTTTRLATMQANTGLALGGAAGLDTCLAMGCQGVATPSFGVCAACLCPRGQHLKSLGWMSGRGVKASATAPSLSISNGVVLSTYSRIERRKPSPRGFTPIPTSRSWLRTVAQVYKAMPAGGR